MTVCVNAYNTLLSNIIYIFSDLNITITFVLTFCVIVAAIGCPDIEAPPLAYVTRDHVQAVIRCNHTSQTWHLVCRDTIWVGEVSNCSDGKEGEERRGRGKYGEGEEREREGGGVGGWAMGDGGKGEGESDERDRERMNQTWHLVIKDTIWVGEVSNWSDGNGGREGGRGKGRESDRKGWKKEWMRRGRCCLTYDRSDI